MPELPKLPKQEDDRPAFQPLGHSHRNHPK